MGSPILLYVFHDVILFMKDIPTWVLPLFCVYMSVQNPAEIPYQFVSINAQGEVRLGSNYSIRHGKFYARYLQ